MNADIESIVRSYVRLSRDVGGRINFACDLDDNTALDAAEREKTHLDQAFFVLSFAALELHITKLASARLPDERQRTAIRSEKFARRWELAVKATKDVLKEPPTWEREEPLVSSWYMIRSDIAHGRSPSRLADVASALVLADKVAATSDAVLKGLEEQRGPSLDPDRSGTPT